MHYDAFIHRSSGVDLCVAVNHMYRSRFRYIQILGPPSLDCCRWRNSVIPCWTRTSRPALAVSATTMDEATASAPVPTMVGDRENGKDVGVNGNGGAYGTYKLYCKLALVHGPWRSWCLVGPGSVMV